MVGGISEATGAEKSMWDMHEAMGEAGNELNAW